MVAIPHDRRRCLVARSAEGSQEFGLAGESRRKTPSRRRHGLRTPLHDKRGARLAILNLNGRLTFGQEDLESRNALERLMKACETRVLPELSGLRKLDSAGMGTLLFAQASFRQAGGNPAILIARPSHVGRSPKHTSKRYSRSSITSRTRSTASSTGAPSSSYDVLELVKSNRAGSVRDRALWRRGVCQLPGECRQFSTGLAVVDSATAVFAGVSRARGTVRRVPR